MSWLWLHVNHKCPYCNTENQLLKYYTIFDENGFIDVGDYIPNNLDTDIGFITAEGYCEVCDRHYQCRVGIRKSRLMEIVIFES